jgi:uncharacterized protein
MPFIYIYLYFQQHRKVFFVSLIASFMAVGLAASRIEFEEDIAQFIPKDKKTENLNQVFQNSKFLDKIVVTVSLKDSLAQPLPDSLIAFAEAFAVQTEQQLTPYIKKSNYRVDDEQAMALFETINQNIPIYLTDNDYLAIDSLTTPQQLKQTLQNNLETLTSPTGMALKSMISTDPVGISFLGLKKLQQLQYDENFELYDGYVMTKDRRHLLLFLTPAYPSNNTGKNEILLDGLSSIIGNISKDKNATASVFGTTVIAVGNALQIRKDTLLTQGITVLFLVLFLGWYFRKKTAPFLILLPVAFGALFSLAIIALVKGHISVIAVSTGSVVLGIAVNYSLHVFNHYRHTNNIQAVIRDLAMPLTVGSLTTIGGFLCLQFVKSEILKDIGLFAALSLIGASLSSLIFLPQLIHSKSNPSQGFEPWEGLPNNKFSNFRIFKFSNLQTIKWPILIVLTFIFGYTARFVRFEADMTTMNYASAQTKQAEAALNKINAFSLQSVYVVSSGKNWDDALLNNEKTVAKIETLKSRNIVKKHSGVSSLIVSEALQKQRIKRWNDYWTAEKKAKLIVNLVKIGADFKFKSSAFAPFKNWLNTHFEVVDKATSKEIQTAFLDDFITEKPNQTTIVTLVRAAKKDKFHIYNSFKNTPAVTVIDKQYITNQFVKSINADFSLIAIMSSLLVFTVLLLMYGRIELALVSFVPMAITWVWILGIMGLFGIQFNIINIIISALIFGLGDDYSLFVMDGLLQEYKTGKKNLSSYKSSIVLSAITTVTGLGVLIFAKHPALRSIAAISIIGIVCVAVISQTLIPFLFYHLISKRTHKKLYPWTAYNFIGAIIGYTYFLFGCLLLSIIGPFLTFLNPFNQRKGKLIYNTILSGFARSQIYFMVNMNKKILNIDRTDLDSPAVIVCNHQSVLDILLTIMLRPKMVLLTNNWVWNSPFFGFVVRMAEFYPVSDGAENSLELLSEKVKQGFSIVVFPEGTRSTDGTVKRFHKGAFFLAEKLNIDILPMVIHGAGDILTKGDLMCKDGTITVDFLPRIKPTDTTFGTDYAQRTKTISASLKIRYNDIKRQTERTHYFKEKLIYNYIYKGPVLEWYMRVKLKLENYYQLFDELVPKQGKMLDIGCGYGFMTYMLHFTSSEREIVGLDYDEEKIETAQHCFSRNDKVHFQYADVTQFDFERYDAIILSDILHYLQPDKQQIVLEKCINSLNENGLIIVRDGNKDLEERHKGTKLSEFFSTKVVGFNKVTDTGLSFLSAQSIKQIALIHGLEYSEIDNTKLTSNILFVLKKLRG